VRRDHYKNIVSESVDEQFCKSLRGNRVMLGVFPLVIQTWGKRNCVKFTQAFGASCKYQYDSKDFFPLSTSQAGDQANYLQQVPGSTNKVHVYTVAHRLALHSEMDILFTLPPKHHPTPIPTQTLGTLTVHHVDTGTI